jgi:hypothetical protein
MTFEADEGHENAGQMAPQVWPSSFFQRCYFHLFASLPAYKQVEVAALEK